MRATTGLLTALALVAFQATADTRMTYSTPGGSSPQISIQGDQVRMEGGARARGVTLFDASAGQMTVIDPSTRSYYRMDAESIREQGRRMAEQMAQMREQMEQQLAKMPEEQREQMRAQMERMLPKQQEAGGGNLRFEPSGKTARVAGIECELTTVYRDDEPVQRVCIARPGSLGMADADRASLRALFGFLQEMASSFGGDHMGARMPARMMERFDGVPIRAEDLDGEQSWALKQIDTGPIDPGVFSIPSGYREVEPFSKGQ